MAESFKIRTSWTPLRMMRGQKEPTYLNVEVKNTSEEPKNYSLILSAPYPLGFDTTAITRERREKIAAVKPNETRKVPFTVFSRANVEQGQHTLELLVKEHEAKFDRVIDESMSTVQLRVE